MKMYNSSIEKDKLQEMYRQTAASIWNEVENLINNDVDQVCQKTQNEYLI